MFPGDWDRHPANSSFIKSMTKNSKEEIIEETVQESGLEFHSTNFQTERGHRVPRIITHKNLK